ncbi:MAG: sulfotransferase [Sciscionella sp.]
MNDQTDGAAVQLRAQLAEALRDATMVQAAVALKENQLAVAERLLKARLRARPLDVPAIRLLAEVAGRLGRYVDAERLLRRALELAPDFDAARANLVFVLHRQSKFEEAHEHADRLLAAHPDDPAHLAAKAAVLVRTGGYEEAICAYERILAHSPEQARIWVSYGHVLKTVGRHADGIAAYRRATVLAPTFGDAWWSLANLKTGQLGSSDVREMAEALERATGEADRYHLHFALGKALEDARRFEESFEHYAEGNRGRRAELPYDPDEASRHLERSRRLLTAEVFAQRAGSGAVAADPIFVVGLPRAGSTLIEQILASHPLVEGTMELPDISSISAELGRRGDNDDSRSTEDGYIARLLELSPSDLKALGSRYLDGTRIQRKTDRPLFIDKMPNNFAHIGLIHLILPNAKIVDARRHPMANCFSAFKQHFSRGQGFTYDLRELARYYRDYATLMQHYDTVLPRRIHRVYYERLVTHPEKTIRELLAYCGLDFDVQCLAFHENSRPVRTASSEQVRRPINSDEIDSWRNYEKLLDPLKSALGDMVDAYPMPLA